MNEINYKTFSSLVAKAKEDYRNIRKVYQGDTIEARLFAHFDRLVAAHNQEVGELITALRKMVEVQESHGMAEMAESPLCEELPMLVAYRTAKATLAKLEKKED